MKSTKAITGLALLLSQSALADVAEGVSGKISTAIQSNNTAESWLDGGLGRFNSGDTREDQTEDFNSTHLNATADLGLKYRFAERFEWSTHIQGNGSTAQNQRDSLGLVEMKFRYLQKVNDQHRFLFTAGQFFLPTSMENTENFWDSPYTITWSSLNSWIGEEFRPIGLDIDYRAKLKGGLSLNLAATAFTGNDSSGALLAWRGFSYGNHLSYLGETLPLANITSLNDGGLYALQKDEGTTPFGEDLDGKVGYAARIAIKQSQMFELKLTHIDNLGDTELHKGEYAWRTQFSILGFNVNLLDNWVLLGEYSQGSSTMGPAVAAVDIDFTTGYLLSSVWHKDWRYSLRYDAFRITDNNEARNQPIAQDLNEEEGQSLTASIFYQPAGKAYSIGFEVLGLESTRTKLAGTNAIQAASFDEQEENQYQVSLEANWTF